MQTPASILRRLAATTAMLLLPGCAERATAPATASAVSLRAERPTLTVAAGDRASVAVLVERSGGFTGAVTVSVSGTPAGVTATVDTQPLLGDRAVVSFDAGLSAPAGPHTLTITAAGEGVADATTTLDLDVGTLVEFDVALTYCPALAPLWVAFQDGDGGWAHVAPTTVGNFVVFRRPFLTEHGGVATVRALPIPEEGATTLLDVFYGHPTELRRLSDTDRIECTEGANTLDGSVVGLDSGDIAVVSGGFFDRFVVGAPATRFSLAGLPAAPLDLLVTRVVNSATVGSATSMILRRDVDVAGEAVPAPFDFGSAEAFAPARALVTVANLGDDFAFTGTRLHTENGETAVAFDVGRPVGATREYDAVPDDRLRPADVQVLSVEAHQDGTSSRSFDLYFRSAAERTLTLGAPAARPTIASVGASLRPRARFVPQDDDYDRATSIFYQQAQSSAVALVTMTGAYSELSGAGYDLVLPDFSLVDGFDPTWTLWPGRTLDWVATRIGGSLDLGPHPRLGDGLTRRTALVTGSTTLR